MLFCCRACADDPCELRIPAGIDPFLPDCCPFGLVDEPRWREVPSGQSPAAKPGADLIPGPFCEIPATASPGRYTIEIGGVDRLEIPVSRTAFNEAVRAMGDADALR